MFFLHLTNLVMLSIFSWHQCLFLYFLMLDGVPEHNEKSVFFFGNRRLYDLLLNAGYMDLEFRSN
jgi:hypothetical protein